MDKRIITLAMLALYGCGDGGGLSSTQLAATTTVVRTATAVQTGTGLDLSNCELVFSEEFDKPLNPNKWNDHIWYERSNPIKNYAVTGGELKIWPQRDARGNLFTRTFDTDRHFSQTYGYFEIEAKLPKGGGTLPAFWLLNHDGTDRVGIDIFKTTTPQPVPDPKALNGVFDPATYNVAAWPGESGKISTNDLTTDFHKYGVKWEIGKETFYFDGQEVAQLRVPINVPMYILVDLWYQNPTPQIITGSTNSLEVRSIHAWKFKMPPVTNPPPSCPSNSWTLPFREPVDTSVWTDRFGNPATKFYCMSSPISPADIQAGCVCAG
jgi:beta-glucanase (GH16 family)